MGKYHFVSMSASTSDRPKGGITFPIDWELKNKVDSQELAEGRRPISLDSLPFYKFITPSNIISYNCNRCDEENSKLYNEHPKASITITAEGKIVNVGYSCNHCGKYVYVSPLISAEGIPEEFIEFDETGEYKKPTPKSIERLFERMDKSASEGERLDDLLRIANTWAKKINYTLPSQRIRQMQVKQREVYLGNLEKELPAILDEIQEKDYAWIIQMEEDDGCSPYEGCGLDSHMEVLFELLREGRIPQNPKMKRQILDTLYRYEGMFRNRNKVLDEEKKGLEKTIAEVEIWIMNAREIRHKFVDAAKMSQDEVSEIRASVLL